MGLAAGILLVIISMAHNVYGEKQQIPALKEITKDPITIGSHRIMVFQGGMVLLAVGIVQILVSSGVIVLTGVGRYFPVGIVLINVCTSLFFILFAHREILKITLPQFAVFALIITLQFLSL